MGKKTPKAPAAPDPNVTAAAQGQWNQFTAQSQQAMNMVGQNSPYGTLDYSQNGFTTITDPSGRQVQVPQYTANVNLTPGQQAIFDQTQQAESNLAGLASDQSAKLRGYLDTPFEFNNESAEQWAYDLGSKRLAPRFDQQRESLRTQLVNSGLRPGTEAYDREMSRFGQTENDAYNQLALTGRGQAFNEALTTRNQPINEITALLAGSQVDNPTSAFAQTPQSQVAGVDYTSLVNQQFQAQMAQYQQKVQSQQNRMGGLFNLGKSIIGALPFSDRRLKSDITRVGTLDNGIPLYRYRIGGQWAVGVMAQEVMEIRPQAVAMDEDGFLHVRYDLATEAA